MITLSKSDESLHLSRIEGDAAVKETDAGAPHVVLSTEGEYVEKGLSLWQQLFPEIKVHNYVIMPDHVHACVQVCDYLPKDFGLIVGKFKGIVSRLRHEVIYQGDEERQLQPFFAKGFNDRIAYTEQIWNRQMLYVDDNPRRYILKKRFPNLFRESWRLRVGNSEYMAMGNILLLHNPHMEVVRFSRRFSEDFLQKRQRDWDSCVRNGGVLVSPFIHPFEKEALKRALDSGGCIIRIRENGFYRKFSPQGRDFDLMCEGRLLFIAPMEHKTQKENLTYGLASELNKLAEAIIATDWHRGGAIFGLVRL